MSVMYKAKQEAKKKKKKETNSFFATFSNVEFSYWLVGCLVLQHRNHYRGLFFSFKQ